MAILFLELNVWVSSLTTKRTFQATRSNANEERQSEGELPSSLRNQKVSLLTTKTALKALRSNANEERQSEGGSQLQEQVPQVPQNCTSSATQGVHEQVQQANMDSITPASQGVHERSDDSTTHEVAEQIEEQGPSSPKRKRGRTQMPRVHVRKERKIIILNEFNQPIGPTKEVVKELGSFLGTLARSGTFCPLNEKYDIPDEAKKWIFESVCSAWRKYKSQLKATHFTSYENDELRMENRPVDVPESHFKDLLNYWNFDPHKKISETNIVNRNKLNCPHTAGRTPFALIREAEMERMQSTQESEDDSHSIDAFASVMGPEHPGRVRLYGRGVTKTVLKGQKGNLGSSDERMQQKMEEMEERMQQRMHEKLNKQKDAMEQNITMNVIARLQRLNPDLRLDPNMLRFSTRSPVDASAAQQAVVQLNSRPSAGSNNQGGVDQEMDAEDDEEIDLT
ncbi:PREDICTED: uncharacterized protein LOC109237116 [Nicotiana attenuata]|uniref:uncharacterized protein LOC109237116 n=1 Tax=Nicotiana attenuata TaxID=49451 RepID=UPI000905D4D7|nr:PREDICTED: uncharacterized protein LOC109237116 [Nicotiana attenuata]